MTKRRVIAGTVVLAALIALVGFAVQRSQLGPTVLATTQPQFVEVPSAEQWVPFSATVRRLHPGKSTDVVGKLYRGSDGSRRLESGPPRNRQAVISINNYTLQKGFGFSEAFGGWFELRQRTATTPPKFRLDGQKFVEHASPVAGFKVLRHVSPNGDVRFLAPDLNGEALLTQLIDGTREELSDVVLSDQDPALFWPPPDALFKPLPPNFMQPEEALKHANPRG